VENPWENQDEWAVCHKPYQFGQIAASGRESSLLIVVA